MPYQLTKSSTKAREVKVKLSSVVGGTKKHSKPEISCNECISLSRKKKELMEQHKLICNALMSHEMLVHRSRETRQQVAHTDPARNSDMVKVPARDIEKVVNIFPFLDITKSRSVSPPRPLRKRLIGKSAVSIGAKSDGLSEPWL